MTWRSGAAVALRCAALRCVFFITFCFFTFYFFLLFKLCFLLPVVCRVA